MNEISKPSELLSIMANTSTEIDVFSDGIIKSVDEGEMNPLHVLIQLRAMEKASDRILKAIKENMLNEADKYPGTSFEFMGNKIEKAELGTKYDYSKCNHPKWNELTAEINELKKELLETESFLKAIKSPLEIFNSETGETSIITVPIKTSTYGLKVTIR